MSSDNPFSRPYQSPSAAGTAGQVKPGGKVKPPGPFLAVSIVGIVLGTMGVFGGCCSAFGLAFQGAGMGMMAAMIEAEGEDTEVAEMLQAMAEESQKYLLTSIAVLSISMLASLAMLVGGSMGCMGKAASKMILIAGCGMAIVTRLVEPAHTYFQQLGMQAIQNDYMERMGNQAMDPSMQAIGPMVTLVIGISVSLLMIVLYIVTIVYLLQSKKLPEYFAAKAAQSGQPAR